MTLSPQSELSVEVAPTMAVLEEKRLSEELLESTPAVSPTSTAPDSEVAEMVVRPDPSTVTMHKTAVPIRIIR
jgi:hypothetical protein